MAAGGVEHTALSISTAVDEAATPIVRDTHVYTPAVYEPVLWKDMIAEVLQEDEIHCDVES
jgi:ABC-type phosphate transport system substrate-binding protein